MSHHQQFFDFWSNERDKNGDVILAVPEIGSPGSINLLDDAPDASPGSSLGSSTNQFRCHWFIASPYSRILAEKRLVDGVSVGTTRLDAPEMIVLDGAFPEDVRMLVDFFYGTPLPSAGVDFMQQRRLRRLADQLDVPLLREACRDWLRQTVDLRRVWEILGEALIDGDALTTKKCLQMIQTAPDVFDLDRVREISEAAALEAVRQTTLPISEEVLFVFVEAFFSAKRRTMLIATFGGDKEEKGAAEILRHIRFGAMAPEFFTSKVKSSGLLSTEDYLAVCESFVAPLGTGDAAPRFSAVKRGMPPMVVVSCRGKESKVLGYSKQENVGEFAAKVRVVLDIGEQLLLKDGKGNTLKEKTLCVHAIKQDGGATIGGETTAVATIFVVRILPLQFQKVGGPLISLDVEETAKIEEIRVKLRPHLGLTNAKANFLLLYDNAILEEKEEVGATGLKADDVVLIIEEKGSSSAGGGEEAEDEREAAKHSVECTEGPANTSPLMLAAVKPLIVATDKDSAENSDEDDEDSEDSEEDDKDSWEEVGDTAGTPTSGDGRPAMARAMAMAGAMVDPFMQRVEEARQLQHSSLMDGKAKKTRTKKSQNKGDKQQGQQRQGQQRKASAPPPGPLKKADSKGNMGNSSLSLSGSSTKAAEESTKKSGGGGSNYKTQLCNSFKNMGKCPKGDKCFYAHGDKELRAAKPATATPIHHLPAPRPTPPLLGPAPPKWVPLKNVINVTESSKMNASFAAANAVLGPAFWASAPKDNVKQPEWIKVEFAKPVLLTRFSFVNGKTKTETPERVQVVGMDRDSKKYEFLFNFNGVVSKHDKDFHSIIIPNPKSFPVFQFNFAQSFGQSIGAGAPYVTALKDFKMFGLEV